jgi:serine/threonine-protein kinase
MQVRRHLPPSLLSTVSGRRVLGRSAIVAGAFALGYLLTMIWFPSSVFSSDQAVPRVLDRPSDEARTRIEKLGFKVRLDDPEPHPKAARGTVVWQDPAPGTVAPAGTTVHLVPSDGPASLPVPDVIGLEESQARSIVQAGGLAATQSDSIPGAADRGVVIATRPGTGVGRDPGSEVVLVVSSGPAEISVPDVVGMSSQQARERLQAAGLAIGAISARGIANKPPGLVIEQRPASGTLSPREGRVDLILSRKPTP